MDNSNLNALEQKIWHRCELMRDDPAARYDSRVAFYKQFGQATLGGAGFGNSELAFMKWEERGVLKPSSHVPPGSQWWSAVNLWFIYLCELAVAARNQHIEPVELPKASQLWIKFIDNPSSTTWYRAHNSSIIDGYLKYGELALLENQPEQIFLNMVLYRLLFAQAMVEEAPYALGDLGAILASPKGVAVDLMTDMEAFYPQHYPLTQEDVNDILGKAHNLEEIGVQILDDVIIAPILTTLYDDAADWNLQPDLKNLIVADRPAYPTGRPIPKTKENIFTRILVWLRQILNI